MSRVIVAGIIALTFAKGNTALLDHFVSYEKYKMFKVPG
jgi:hypothetical protein